jgi:HK97 family phage major capsid protein
MAAKQLEIAERRHQISVQLDGLLKKVEAEHRGLTPDERKRADVLQAQLEAVELDGRKEQSALAMLRHEGEASLAGGIDEDSDAGLSLLADLPLPRRTVAVLGKLQTLGAAAAQRVVGGQRVEPTEAWRATIAAAFGGNAMHPAVLAATSTEGIASEGGFAVPAEVAPGIWTRAVQGSVWARIGARLEAMRSDTKAVVALDDADESSDQEAGLQAAWTAETATLTAQVMKLRLAQLTAHKLMVVAATSNELADDGPGYIDELQAALGRAISKKFDRSAISGTGVGQPLGILNSPATIVVAKTVNGDPGAANTFTWNHAAGMWARLAPGSHENAWWLMHPSVLPQALGMHIKVQNVAATENVGGFTPGAVFQQGGPTGYMMLGRPVLITSRVKALSSAGDVILVDPTQVAIGIRRDIIVERSEHALFTADCLAIRGKFRGDVRPLWETPRTLQEGATTVSPYVVLAAR